MEQSDIRISPYSSLHGRLVFRAGIVPVPKEFCESKKALFKCDCRVFLIEFVQVSMHCVWLQATVYDLETLNPHLNVLLNFHW